MRKYILISLTVLQLIIVLYFSSQLEQEIHKNIIAFNECEQQFPLQLAKEFFATKKAKNVGNYPLTGAGVLNLDGLNIIGLPNNFFGQSDCIKKLSIDNNKLKTLPKAIQDLQRLQTLHAYKNQISYIPKDFFSSFQYLLNLNLFENKLENFDIENSNIENLRLYSNQLKTFNVSNTTINYLDLSNNKIQVVPKCISHIKKLETLNLSNNELSEFSNISIKNDTISKQLTLQDVNISYNFIKQLDINTISNSIKHLNLKGNKISKITGSEIKKNLISLDLSYNLELKHFSIDKLVLFSNLKILKLHATNINAENRQLIKEYCYLNDIKVNFSNEKIFSSF